MNAPRLSIGLPVYNGEEYLAQSLDALLGQTYTDFELVVSSNASTDATDDICRDYAARDPRIRFHRQVSNVGAVPNHNFVLDRARGELFKWASGDDLYARDLLERCIALLDSDPTAVLAHAWTAAIDADNTLIQALPYPLATDAQRAPERLRSALFGGDALPGAICADDFYGVFRTDVLRSVKPLDSYFHSDRTYMAELALHGRFLQVPEWLYFRRHHPGRTTTPEVRAVCRNLDPRRADRWRHPTVRLVGEYVWDYFAMIGRAPLTESERRQCYGLVMRWLGHRIHRRLPGATHPAAPTFQGDIHVDAAPVASVVAGQTHRT